MCDLLLWFLAVAFKPVDAKDTDWNSVSHALSLRGSLKCMVDLIGVMKDVSPMFGGDWLSGLMLNEVRAFVDLQGF